MGIDVRIESEEGVAEAELLDPQGMTEQPLATLVEGRSCCLRFIDPYGDTTFNQLQLPVLMRELEDAINTVSDPDVKQHGRAILKFAKRASSHVHTYLKFYGD